ncbi:biopolymer transporter Tol [Occallatibacter riparius]|uniref:Biopolymer transporter Tol n=1 Tax=Occallatibacter riparius TaxID=1002689 RepID=A0A9J7BMC7_9BACT|nr:biopolymer transporter Tol [Occallatibacter riparius]UWZ84036.1 biopolymer transporter Tol [Occallatibacter riparius]
MKAHPLSPVLNFALLLPLAVAPVAPKAQVAAPQVPQSAVPQAPQVPDWAQPGSSNHQQVAPPADFHRPTVTLDKPIGIFENQSDIGGPLVPGDASYDPATKQYTIRSAGYNIWYQRDEFRFLWKKMSGDVSLAADAAFPTKEGFGDRKVVLVIRQSLDDDSKEAMAGEHGTGMTHLAWRAAKGEQMKDMEYRFGGQLTDVMPNRIGIEKHGDQIALFISLKGEPIHQFGPPVTLAFDGPFYVGIGFCSHQPTTVDTGLASNVTLENRADAIR